MHLHCFHNFPQSVQKSAPSAAHVRNQHTVIVPLNTSSIVATATTNMVFGDLVWSSSRWDHERIVAWNSVVSLQNPLPNCICWLHPALHRSSSHGETPSSQGSGPPANVPDWRISGRGNMLTMGVHLSSEMRDLAASAPWDS